jgi:5-methyltetrahydropteroyltriglutamate--homocysteine methyltransferase
MPPPRYVKDLLGAGSLTGAHDTAWQRRMDDSIRFVIGMQEQAGFDMVSDGEWRLETYVDVIAEIMHGFQWLKRDVFVNRQVVTARMTPRCPDVVAEGARFLRENTRRHLKVCLPSPYRIGARMCVPEHSQAAYPSRAAFCEALVPVLRQELLAIKEVSVDVIQLDEPHLCVLVDLKQRARFPDPGGELRRAVNMIKPSGGVSPLMT